MLPRRLLVLDPILDAFPTNADMCLCVSVCACGGQLLLRGAGPCADSVRLVFDLLVHGRFPTPLLATHLKATSSNEPRSEEEGDDEIQCPECLSRQAIMKEAAVLPVIFSLVPALPPDLQVPLSPPRLLCSPVLQCHRLPMSQWPW